MVKRLQNKIAESRFSLPITAIYSVAVWLAGGLIANQLYLHFLLFGLSAYLMVELNNSNSLIRIYSRMVSCSFMALTLMAAFLFDSTDVWVVQFCVITAYLILFKCYQNKRAQGLVFYAFFFIGIASIFFIQILFFVPFLWIMMRANLMTFNIRLLLASLIGLTAPYWFLAGWFIFNGTADLLLAHIKSIAEFTPLFQYDFSNIHNIVTFAYITIIAIIGMFHFMRNSYKDKIRIRMIYEIFITMNALTFVFIILQPQHIKPLLSIMIINSSALVAHYIALTNTKTTNITFCCLAVCTLGLTVYNLWIP